MMMEFHSLNNRPVGSRREFLRQSGAGFGALALAALLGDDGLLSAETGETNLHVRPPHGPPRAKAIIQLFQNGGVSQMDVFDPKPELTRQHGKPHPGDVETFQIGNKNVLMRSPFKFHRGGQSGMDFSEVVPHLGSMADELCLVRSMHTGHNNHTEAILMFQGGRTDAGFPGMGSWICYALGSENQNLPGYVVLRDPEGYNTSGKLVWSSAFLPTMFSGTEFSTSGSPVHHLAPPGTVSAEGRQRSLELLARLNAQHLENHAGNSELETRIANYELAARMQLAATRTLDASRETPATRRLYGLDNPKTAGYGLRCMMARRLVESGVRFVQVFPPLKPEFQPWDHHGGLEDGLRTICSHVDQPSAALIQDLKQRGLLDDVIVMWTSEFGRLPITEGRDGRDHNRHAFSMLLAGGGFKAGLTYGATDEFGYKAVENRVSVHDLHATLLHRLGLDHTKLSYEHSGRAERLTDPEVTGARVVDDLFV